MKNKFLLLLIFSAQFTLSHAQDTDVCVQNIELAQQRFDEGRIQDIQPLLSSCINNGSYNKAQKSQALRLLTLSYIFLEEEKNSEASMLELLETFHEFEVNPAIDPTEFINLHDRYRYKPIFNLGARYITNFAQPIVSELNSALDLSSNRPVYSTEFSFIGFGINFEYEFAKNFVFYPEIQYRITSISRSESQKGLIAGNDFLTIVNAEDQQWLSVPVSVKYNFTFTSMPKFKLYANMGGALDLSLKATKPSDQSVLNMVNAPPVGFTINTNSDKNNLNFSVLVGGGATYKIGEGFLSLEARYVHSLTSFTKSDKILSPTDPAQINTLVQDDIYRLNYIAISLGYTMNIYLPKLLR